ncbi:uncharacterized protein LOC143043436 [Mytilus galloprovincialis]|uniref:uncharacterized protein LOC143043436 n=1 Tax=Mytilus galloprovincialis TaxID=29158 RepID=UPI003F7CD2CC
MRENICVECRLGYTSFSRKSCVPCPNNTFGERCAGICSCIATQRCDHVKGCISNTSTPVNHATDIFVEDTSIQSSIKTTNFRKRNVSTIKPSLKTTENGELNDPSLKPISIYSISVASLTFMLVIGILLIVNCRRYTGTRSQKSETKENNIKQTSQTVER